MGFFKRFLIILGLMTAIAAGVFGSLFLLSLIPLEGYGLLVLAGAALLITWGLSNITGALAHTQPIIYYLLCIVFALAAAIARTCMGDFVSPSADATQINMWYLVITYGMQISVIFLAVPILNTDSDDYLVTETTYDEYGFEIKKEQWTESYYMSGTVKKALLVIFLGGFLAAVSQMIVALWFVFVGEFVFIMMKLIKSAKAMRY